MTPLVRPYAPADRAACHHVFYRAVHEGAAGFYDAAQRRAWAPEESADVSRYDKLAQQQAWVAEVDGTIAGFMSLEQKGHIDMAFVVPEVMGRGIAGALYAALLGAARARGMTRLEVDASHLARRFFEKRGWAVEYGERHPARGQVLERFRMSLSLEDNPQ